MPKSTVNLKVSVTLVIFTMSSTDMNEKFANAFADVQNLETLANISAQAASLPNDEVKQFCTSRLHLIVLVQNINKERKQNEEPDLYNIGVKCNYSKRIPVMKFSDQSGAHVMGCCFGLISLSLPKFHDFRLLFYW